MPDFPLELRLAAERAIAAVAVDFGHEGLIAGHADQFATAVLEATAAQLGEHVAAKITAHMDAHGPRIAAVSPSLREAGLDPVLAGYRWRRHRGIAARIAARAFLTDEDVKRLAAEALAKGDFVACPNLEGDDD